MADVIGGRSTQSCVVLPPNKGANKGAGYIYQVCNAIRIWNKCIRPLYVGPFMWIDSQFTFIVLDSNAGAAAFAAGVAEDGGSLESP